MGEWNLKKNNAAQKASRAGSAASGTAASGSTGSGSPSGTANRSTGSATRLGSDTSRNVTVPYMAMLMRSQGKMIPASAVRCAGMAIPVQRSRRSCSR